MLGVSNFLYFYFTMNEQHHIFKTQGNPAPIRPFAPRRRP